MPDTTISDALRATSLITTALMSAEHPNTQKFTEAIDAVNALRSYFGAARDLAEHEDCEHDPGCEHRNQVVVGGHEEARRLVVVGGHEEARRLVGLLEEADAKLDDKTRLAENLKRALSKAEQERDEWIDAYHGTARDLERQLEDALEAGRALEEQRNVAVREVERLREIERAARARMSIKGPLPETIKERAAAEQALEDALSADTQREP